MVKKPNLLFMFADQQRADTIRALGNRFIHTPNLDYLARMSTVFYNTYVTQPVCTPSRGTLMTGLYPHTHGLTENNLVLDDNIKCLPEMPDFEEYVTGYYGKWHLGDEVHAQHGFDFWESVDDGYHAYDTGKYDKSKRCGYTKWLISKGIMPDTTDPNGYPYHSRKLCVDLPEQYSKAWYVGTMGEEFIKNNANRPFILYLNFFEPHPPITGPLNELYDWRDISLPPNHSLPEDVPLKCKLFSMSFCKRFPDEEAWRRLICRYYGLVTMVDRQVGRVLDALEASGQLDNTVIIYTSDHGEMLASHKLYGKCTMYQEAIRVPFLLKLPGQKEQRIIHNPVSHIDVVPTLLDIMGADPYPECEGVSLYPYLLDKNTEPTHDVFITWNGGNNNFGDKIGEVSIEDDWRLVAADDEIKAAMRDRVCTIITAENWKLSLSPLGEHQLFNLKDDPYEMNNLWGKVDCDDLIMRIKNWQQKFKFNK